MGKLIIFKTNLEESLNLFKTNCSRYEEKLQTYKAEIKKVCLLFFEFVYSIQGNQIIQQFQNLLKSNKAELKIQKINFVKQEQEWKEKLGLVEQTFC